MAFRVGLGFDAHPLVEGRPLVLGGHQVPHNRGLSGHSDGDVLAHAILDALLGAAGLGDKGKHFPPGDPQWKGVSSMLLLSRVAQLLIQARWRIVNIDATMIAQRPALSPYFAKMQENISAALSIGPSQVRVTATTTDRLGFLGREEGIAALAVALIEEEQ